jgi:hypothetical protein
MERPRCRRGVPPGKSGHGNGRLRTADNESFARLHRADWSVGEVRILTAEGPLWWVSGTNGEKAVSARGRTQAEAWHRACEQAEAAGMLGKER